MTYNLGLLNGTNGTNLLLATQGINQASDYVFGTFLAIAIYMGMYFLFKKEETIREMLISGFVSSIIAVLLILANLITWQIFIALLFLFFVTFLLNFFTN